MVQDRRSGEVSLDPLIDLMVAPQAADGTPQTVRLTKGQASNRLLQAATVHFSSTGKVAFGRWRFAGATIQRNGSECTVEPITPALHWCGFMSVAGCHHFVIRHPPGIEASVRGECSMIHCAKSLIAMGCSVHGPTDAVLRTLHRGGRRRAPAEPSQPSWSSVWYLLRLRGH